MSWKKGGHRAAVPREKKGVDGSCGVFLKRVGSYERSVSYGGYGSCGARKCGVIAMKGDLKLTTPVLVGPRSSGVVNERL